MNRFPIIKYSFTSNNYDDFIEKLTVANVEQEILELGAFIGTARLVIGENVSINKFIVNRKVLQKGNSIQGFITFTIYKPNSLFNWRKHEMKKGMIGILWNREHESITAANFEAYPISIKENFFLNCCLKKGFPNIIQLFEKNDLLHVSEIKLVKIRKLINFILRSNHVKDSQLSHLMEIELVDLLIDCLSDVLDINPNIEINNRHFYNVVDYINEYAMQLTSVSKICENNNVTERTLRRWFQRKFEISPKQYLSFLRLNKVRRILKNELIDSNISENAYDFNYWHMSQFTKDYKILFNELPSKTLKTIGKF